MDFKADELQYIKRLVKADISTLTGPKKSDVGYKLMLEFRKQVVKETVVDFGEANNPEVA